MEKDNLKKISVDNDELASYVRSEIDKTLQSYKAKFALWLECFLEFHGITISQYYSGDKYYTMEVPDDRGGVKTVKVWDRAPKLRNVYTAVKFALSQVNKNTPEFLANIGDFSLEKIAETYAQFVKNEWNRSRAHLEIDMGWINFLLFGEMIYRTYYEEETRTRHYKLVEGESKKGKDMVDDEYYEVDKITYRGVRAKHINSFKFLVAKDGVGDIQDASWVAIRVMKTREEIAALFPDIYKTPEDVLPYNTGTKDILNPEVFIQRLYETKLDPNTKEYLASAAYDIGIDRSATNVDDTIEVIEFFSKELDCQLLMIGDKIIEAKYMESDHYPIVYHRANYDTLTTRGISDVEQAIPLSKTVDDLFDLKLKNYALQLSMVILYNKNYFQDTPTFEPGAAIGIDAAPGTSLSDVMSQMSKYSQNFEIRSEQAELEQKMFLSMSMNPQVMGAMSSASDTTARESMIRNAASTAALDDTVRRVERTVYSEIANQWVDLIALNYTEDMLFAIKNDDGTRYAYFLAGVTIEDKGKYLLYNYRGYNFYEVKESEDLVDSVIQDMLGANEVNVEQVSYVLDDIVGGQPADTEKPTEVKEDTIGKWSEFTGRMIEKTNGKVQHVITRADFDMFRIGFSIEATQGLKLNKQILADNLMKMLPFLQGAMENPAMLPYIKYLLALNDIIPDKLLKDLEKQVTQAQMVSPEGEVVAKGDQAIEMSQQMGGQTAQGEAMRPENLARQNPDTSNIMNMASIPGSPEKTNNPSGM